MKNIIALILVATLVSCHTKTSEETNVQPENQTSVILTPDQMKNAGVVTSHMEQKDVYSLLKTNGMIDVPPQNKVSISVPLGGYLKETKLLPGLHINKGEVIALMEDPQYIQLQQDYLTAKSRLSYYEAEFNRQKELNVSKASSDKIFQQASSDFASQKILVKSLAEKLRLISINPETLSDNTLSRNIQIYAPITGYVSRVNVNIGKYTKPEEVLFEIVNPEDIHLVLNVFEKDINRLFIGQKVIAYTNNNPEKKYDCEIILIGKDFSSDRSVEVHCHFKDYDKTLIPGMFMNADIEIQNKNAYVLPDEAIVSNENRKYIFVEKQKGEYEMTEVLTGNSSNGYTEIMNANDKLVNRTVVTKGAYSLLMKLKNTGE